MTAPILTPHALPMFRDDMIIREGGAGGKRKRDKERVGGDGKKTKRPEAPVSGPGRGGRVGASATQHVVQSLVRDTTRDEDMGDFFFFFSVGMWRWRCSEPGSLLFPVGRSVVSGVGISLCWGVSGSLFCHRRRRCRCALVFVRFLLTVLPLQPREALLKYADTENNPLWTAGTWPPLCYHNHTITDFCCAHRPLALSPRCLRQPGRNPRCSPRSKRTRRKRSDEYFIEIFVIGWLVHGGVFPNELDGLGT